jgi:cell division protein FtsL
MKLDTDAWLRDAWTFVKISLIAAIPVGLLVFHVWNQYWITELGYRVSKATQQHRALLEKNRKLRIEATYLGRPERMASAAREKGQFHWREPEQIVELPEQETKEGVDLAQNSDRNRASASQ